jgi:hypothetical protein
MDVAKKVEVVTNGAMGVVINETEVMTSGTMITTKEKESHYGRRDQEAEGYDQRRYELQEGGFIEQRYY